MSYSGLQPFAIELPLINGEPTLGIQAVVDMPPNGDIRLPVLINTTTEDAATYAACAIYRNCQAPGTRVEPRIAAVCAYSIIKYGLFGYIGDLEKDGRWDAVEVPNPAVLSARNEFSFDAAMVRQILTVILSTKVSFWSMNHHVGQDGASGYLRKVLDLFAMTGDNLINTFHNAGHWAGTIRVLRHMGIDGLRATRDYSDVFPIRFRLSDDFRLRMTGLPAGVGKLAIARAILQRMVKHPAMRLTPEVGDFEHLAECYNMVIRNRARFHIGSAYLTGEHRIDTADHIQSRVLGRLGAFASIFYSETSLFKSPAVNGPDGKRFTSYEDYDSEFTIKLAQLKRVKISDEIMAQLTTNRQFNEPDLIDRISQILVVGAADESRRSARGIGPVVNVPSVNAGEVI